MNTWWWIGLANSLMFVVAGCVATSDPRWGLLMVPTGVLCLIASYYMRKGYR